MSEGDETGSPDQNDIEDSVGYDQINKQINTLIDNEDVLINNSEDIISSFDSFFESDYEFNDFDRFQENLNVVLLPEFDDIDDFADVGNALINIVPNIDADTISSLREAGADNELTTLLKELKLNYGHQLNRNINRLQKGRNWWSNIKTNTGFRSRRPIFEHELTVDYTNTVVFNSNINSTLILINHFVKQLNSVPDLVGEDALLEMDKDEIDVIINNLEGLKDDIEGYSDEIESISQEGQNSAEPAEDSSSESESE